MGVVIGNSGGQKRRKRSYMIRISQLKLSVNHSEEDLKKKAAKTLKLQPADIRRVTVVKQSVDARSAVYLYGRRRGDEGGQGIT